MDFIASLHKRAPHIFIKIYDFLRSLYSSCQWQLVTIHLHRWSEVLINAYGWQGSVLSDPKGRWQKGMFNTNFWSAGHAGSIKHLLKWGLRWPVNSWLRLSASSLSVLSNAHHLVAIVIPRHMYDIMFVFFTFPHTNWNFFYTKQAINFKRPNFLHRVQAVHTFTCLISV